MRRALGSFVFGVLFTFALLMLSSVSGAVGLIAVRLLSASSYVLFWRPWFGLDCANADSISDKLNCAGLMLAGDVLIYSAISFVLLTLITRFQEPDGTKSPGQVGNLGMN
jgi:hypothetical protein